MRTVAPQYFLSTRSANCQGHQDYPVYPMAIGVMIFLLEGSLSNEFHSTTSLARAIEERWQAGFGRQISRTEAMDVVNQLLFTVIQNDGIPYVYSEANPATGTKIEVPVKLVEPTDFDLSNNETTFRLTSQGLELLYSTKEIPNELQITVEQLYLRQQYEDGHFEQAMKHIRNIQTIIETLSLEIDFTLRSLQSDALSVSIDEIKSKLERKRIINQREKKEFELLQTSVRDDLKRTESEEVKSERDDQALGMLRRIQTQLRQTAQSHVTLFNQTMKLMDTFMQSRSQRIAVGRRRKVHYRNHVLQPCMDINAKLELARCGVHFLFRQSPQFFNPLWCFDPQRLRSDAPDESEQPDDYSSEDHSREMALRRLREKEFTLRVLGELMSAMPKEGPLTLKEFINGLDRDFRSEIEDEFRFYFIFLQLYRMGVIDLVELAHEELFLSDSDLYDVTQLIALHRDENPDLYRERFLTVTAGADDHDTPGGVTITNFRIWITSNVEEVLPYVCP